MTGDFDEEKNTVHWVTQAKDVDGSKMVQHTSITIKNADERVLVFKTSSEQKDEFNKFMQITFKRRKE